MNIKNSRGLAIEFLDNGALSSINADPIRISLKATTLFSKSGTNIYLRKKTGAADFKALLGPEGNGRFSLNDDAFVTSGSWDGLEYTCTLKLSPESLSWQWSIDLQNNSGRNVELDLVYVQDIGLKPLNAGLINEYYVSQYLERRILEDEEFGAVICCRQNMKESTGHPWLMLACRVGAASGCTDGMQFYGKSCRETGMPEGLLKETLGGEYAGESSVVALQAKPFTLSSGAAFTCTFLATYLPDHPGATADKDLERLPQVFGEFGTGTPSLIAKTGRDSIPISWHPSLNLFNTAPYFPVDELDEFHLNRFFGSEQRHVEMENGHLLSFFNSQNNHIVLKEKEVLSDRPHAHIMQARAGYAPDETIMATTSFASGVFNSHISQGNTNFNVLLSIATSAFGLSRETGQRIFVETGGTWHLLGVPSAFEMGLNHCRWIYKSGRNCFQVRTWTSKKVPQVNMDFQVISGGPVGLLITHDFDGLNGWKVIPGEKTGEFIVIPRPDSMIAGKFPGARYRMIVQNPGANFMTGNQGLLYPGPRGDDHSLLVMKTDKTMAFCMSFIGEVCSPIQETEIEDADYQWISDSRSAWAAWKDLGLDLALHGDHPDIAAIREILPWYGMNALTHFLTPYGLEQFSGAAWGTRDVSQGPIDLLVTLEKYAESRQVLCTIFSNQNPDGGWPQWWMFDSYRQIRAGDSHGDIFYWCLIALSQYIKVTGDLRILDETLPYYHPDGPAQAEKTLLSEHVDRLIRMITDSFISGTALVPFGGGDWNDSLQPVSKDLAGRMISSWTVEMNYQAFSSYKDIYILQNWQEKADNLVRICERIRADFNTFLVKDGIVAGYGLVERTGNISVLLHPADTITGIKYSILPMERGIISGIFTKEQALFHQDLIEKQLKGPDGARLMDRPLKYRGGIQTIFQRAESSTFFGREIGLMYVHEHIRYAEALAKTGKADAFVKALRQAIPVGYRDIVPCGDIRQSNCYYSSSDAVFRNRYEADEKYDDVITGKMTLRGGWRVYSSGPGIYIGIIITRLLGIRVEADKITIDPVLPRSIDGLSVSLELMGYKIRFNYSVKNECFSPKKISINGIDMLFNLEDNPYRTGGAVIPLQAFTGPLVIDDNVVLVEL
jgi:1,2-beta-oligoglucan phosphorylase